MLFSSLIFLFVFLPAILLVYYSVPQKGKNTVLLVFSILFYAWGGVSATAILILSIIINFVFARQVSKQSEARKKWMIVAIVFNILLLGTFKYLVFFGDVINDVSWLVTDGYKPFNEFKIALPLGISFFTFQQMSMIWDLYREEKPRKVHFLETALYIGFFPQLIAGPIVRYHDIIEQIKSRISSIELINSGISKFIVGLFKKVILANTCAMIVDPIMAVDPSELSAGAAWLGIFAYALQLYFDFSGYSDMAIGLGRMFGFRILENFNFPYVSRSITEFWRRWHISLSSWFKDYVYIPLGGNRVAVKRMYFNLGVVFLLTGFWHGATWNFILWGAFHGAFLLMEKAGLGKMLKKLPSLLSWSYAILVVTFGWVLFRVETLPNVGAYYGSMFGYGSGNVSGLSFLDPEKIAVVLLAIISCFPVLPWLRKKIRAENAGLTIVKNFGLLLTFLYTIMVVNSGSYNPFIYFRF